jgi:hypothetical protein
MAAGVSATAIAVGGIHSCVIEAGGGVKCWGANNNGQLGIGSTEGQTSPVSVPGERERPTPAHPAAHSFRLITCIQLNLTGTMPRRKESRENDHNAN